MQMPENARDIGWFAGSARSSEIGGTLLSGHFDTPTGRPAVLYRLRELREGDLVILINDAGQQLNYQVTQIISQDYKIFPLDLVYGKVDYSELRILTCDGVWNKEEKSYSKRLVIYARQL